MLTFYIEVEMSQRNYIGQISSLRPFNKQELAADSYNTLRLESKNELVILRFLMSKMIYTEEVLSELDISGVFLSFEAVSLKCATIDAFGRKNNHLIFTIRHLVQSLEAIQRMPPQERFQVLEYYRGYKLEQYLSRRYYFGIKGQLIHSYRLWIETRFKKQFAAKAYIGKGYNDKGTAKNVAEDGSPGWKEVALSESNRVKERSEAFERIERYYQELRSHQSQLVQYTGRTKIHSPLNVVKHT
jgi:hypothetical protein